MSLEWERINENSIRLKVHKGWLVQISWGASYGRNFLLRWVTFKMFGEVVFVPDKDHEWKI